MSILDDDARSLLVQLSRMPHAALRIAAAAGMGEIAPDAHGVIREALVRLEGDSDGRVRDLATEVRVFHVDACPADDEPPTRPDCTVAMRKSDAPGST